MSRTHPDHWHSYLGPANWYRIWYPPHWELQETDGAVHLVFPDHRGALVFNSFWVGEGRNLELGAAVDVTRLFPRSKKVRHLKPLDVPYQSLVLEGDMAVDAGFPWWKRLWTDEETRRWRAWAIQHGPVTVLVSFVQPDATDPELLTMIGMVLNTVQIPDYPAEPPQLFAERVLQLARTKFPLLKARHGREFQLQLGESNVNLFNFYRLYVQDPEKFEEIMLPALTTVVQVQEWGTAQTEPPLEQVRERIMPMLYPEKVWRESFPNFVAVPWVAGLMILYVVDESQAYWYIRDDLLDVWNLTRDELHALALENLETYFEDHTMEFTLAGEEEGPRLLMPIRPDAYNTARLLSPAFHRKLSEYLGQEFAVGIPSRDFCVAVSLGSEATIEQIRQKVAEDFSQMDHPLSERLLLVSADGVSEY